jgi:methionyl-tRNA formyltransferase
MTDFDAPKRAVVFGYHNVGVRCLKVLLAGGVDVALVVTHEDSASENIWFESVISLCQAEGIPYITPADAKSPELLEQVKAIEPDLMFSFYYRNMLPAELLAVAPAFNMHGSLLPEFRGRAPVNWAVLHGANVTGATLHEMTVKPDAGAIVSQMEVPILPDDTAFECSARSPWRPSRRCGACCRRCWTARRRDCTTTSPKAATSAAASPRTAASTG